MALGSVLMHGSFEPEHCAACRDGNLTFQAAVTRIPVENSWRAGSRKGRDMTCKATCMVARGATSGSAQNASCSNSPENLKSSSSVRHSRLASPCTHLGSRRATRQHVAKSPSHCSQVFLVCGRGRHGQRELGPEVLRAHSARERRWNRRSPTNRYSQTRNKAGSVPFWHRFSSKDLASSFLFDVTARKFEQQFPCLAALVPAKLRL